MVKINGNVTYVWQERWSARAHPGHYKNHCCLKSHVFNHSKWARAAQAAQALWPRSSFLPFTLLTQVFSLQAITLQCLQVRSAGKLISWELKWPELLWESLAWAALGIRLLWEPKPLKWTFCTTTGHGGKDMSWPSLQPLTRKTPFWINSGLFSRNYVRNIAGNEGWGPRLKEKEKKEQLLQINLVRNYFMIKHLGTWFRLYMRNSKVPWRCEEKKEYQGYTFFILVTYYHSHTELYLSFIFSLHFEFQEWCGWNSE